MNPTICPTCHAPIPAHAPGGFCPACLLRDAEEPPANGHAAPSLEEIAAAFPQLEVIGLIGQGGMGFVYQVRQPGLDRTVALKILSPELGRDPAFAERFARESRALGKLNHPNIVTVFEHGVSQPSTLNSQPFFYLLMEYVDGVNLRQAMRAGRFTPEQALAIVPGICDALQAAHAQGIWHRDIKPENILLDARGGVKIADFGIARMVGDPQRNFTLTMTGGALGSAAYMAPEQHETPRDVDHRADIYSLGVVIYEMLTGELPLGRFPAPSQRAAVNARIDEIVFKTLEKERELRQQSANEVKTEMEGAGILVTTKKKPITVAIVLGIGCLILVLLAVLGVSLSAIGFYLMKPVTTHRGPTSKPEIHRYPVVPVEQRPILDGGIVGGFRYSAFQVRRREVPLLLVIGEGCYPLSASGGSGQEGLESKVQIGKAKVSIVMWQENRATVNGIEYDLTDGRVLFIRSDGTLRQIDHKLDRVLENDNLETYIGGLSLELSDLEAPEAVIEKIFNAAMVPFSGPPFASYLSKSFEKTLRMEGKNPQKLFRGFGRLKFIEAMLTGEKAAEVLMESTEETKRKFKFQMVVEDGAWVLTNDGL